MAFDWNGTIVADTEVTLRANNEVLKHFGFKPISLGQYRKHYDVPIRKYWISLGLDPNFFDQHAKEQERIFLSKFEPEEKRVRTRTGAKQILEYLKRQQIECLIFSNHIIPHIEARLEGLGIKKYFSKVLARPQHNRDHQHKKFKDQFLRDYIKAKKLTMKEIVIVGDTVEEIEIAKNFGCHSVAITGGHNSTLRLKAMRPDFLIHNLTELKRIIIKLNKPKVKIL